MTLSVIIPNYNHGRYLPRCLSGILAQSFQPKEILVLDDVSTDNSVEVIKGIAQQHPSVKLIQNEKNLGVMPNLNKGVELATSDYIFICSADDEVLPGLFKKSMDILRQFPNAALSCSASEWCDTASGLKWHMATKMSAKPACLSPQDLVKLGQAGHLLIVSASAVWRRKPLCEAGLFHPDLRWHADWFASYIPAFRYGLCFLPEPLSVTNILPKSFYTSGVRRPEHRQVLLRILQLLEAPENADVRQRVIDSGALALFAMPMLRLLLVEREYRAYLNATFVRRTLWRATELTGKRILPGWLARLVLKVFYPAPASSTT
ncbi:MAG TPA: glycosyltransferase family A protein [Clostridia bacterium]|nr:glycosyltransferase family A protein [Clostridia bacterium]